MMIDVNHLLPLLNTAKKAKAELATSDAQWHALKKADQLAQLDSFLARDEVSQKAYDEACRQIIAALDNAVLSSTN